MHLTVAKTRLHPRLKVECYIKNYGTLNELLWMMKVVFKYVYFDYTWTTGFCVAASYNGETQEENVDEINIPHFFVVGSLCDSNIHKVAAANWDW